MGKGLEQFEELKDDAVGYARLRWASMRLAAVDRLSTSLSGLFGMALVIALGLVALAFFMTALALWLGELMGHYSLGFLVAGGVLLVVGAIVFCLRRRLIVNSLVRLFAGMFFSTKTKGDE